MEHLIIKGIGPDRPGIVSEISKYVTSNNGNIEETKKLEILDWGKNNKIIQKGITPMFNHK